MADIGVKLQPATLPVTYRRDFISELEYRDANDNVAPWPPGDLFIEFATDPALIEWHYSLSGTKATLKVPAAVVDTLPFDEVGYQLVWKAAGETGGGEAIQLGCAYTQTPCCD